MIKLSTKSQIIAAVVLAILAVPSWCSEHIYLLKESSTDKRPGYSLSLLGSLEGARKVALPSAGGHVLALTDTGRVWGWGNNLQGELATGDTQNREGWVEVESLENIISIAAGTQHSVALRADGTVWAWGANDQGQLGNTELMNALRPVLVRGLDNITMIAAGPAFTLALRSDGTVWAFGSNWGNIVPGDTRRIITDPVQIKNFTPVEALAVYKGGAYAKEASGRILSWAGSDRREAALPEVLPADTSAALTAELGRLFARNNDTLSAQVVWPSVSQENRILQLTADSISVLAGNASSRYSFHGIVIDVDAGWGVAFITTDGHGAESQPGIGKISSGNMKGSSAIAAWTASGGVVNFSSSVPTISAADTHNVVRRADGTVCSWGDNRYGQLGDSTVVNRLRPVGIYGQGGFSAVATGWYHTLALKNDGTVWAWGYNGNGELGDGTTNDRPTPFQVPGLTGMIAVAAGQYHSLALKNDGTVWAWGYNASGRLGDGTTTQRVSPVQVIVVSNIVAISAGSGHSMALRNDGTVWTWGEGSNGQLGDGTTVDKATPVQVPSFSGAIAIAAGNLHSVVMKNDGSVWAWGYNGWGQLGNGNTAFSSNPVRSGILTGMVAIAAGANHSVAMKSDGTVWAWGQNSSGQLGDATTTQRLIPVQTTGFGAGAGIAAGAAHTIAVKSDGTVWAWGDNSSGTLGTGTTTQSVVPVAAAACTLPIYAPVILSAQGQRLQARENHSFALKSDGTVWAWGRNANGQLGDGSTTDRNTPVQTFGLTNATAIATGFYHGLAVKNDGTIWTWGENANGQLGDGTTGDHLIPTLLATVSGVSGVAAGQYHSLALKSDGSIRAWGYNGSGRLGDGTTTQRLSPVLVGGLTHVIAVAAGQSHSMALKDDGTVWAWGENSSGQLGDGTTTDRTLPTQVFGLTGVIAISAGYNHSAALRNDGTVWTWGYGGLGQLGYGGTGYQRYPVRVSDLSGVVAISAGNSYTLAVKADGSVWGSGYNANSQLGDSTTTTRYVPVKVFDLAGAVAVAAGGTHSLALKGDGSIYAWGVNNFGQFGIPTPASSTFLVYSWSIPAPEIAGDFDNSGKPDLVWQNNVDGSLAVWFMGGPQGNTFLGWTSLSAGAVPGWRIVTVADMNRDGHPDLLWQNNTSREAVVWYMAGQQGNVLVGFSSLSFGGVPGWFLATAADLNGDGVPDLVWQNDSSREAVVWYMGGPLGNALLSSKSLSGGPVPGWRIRGSADYNHDGVPDLVWQNDSTREVVLWYMGGAQGGTRIKFNALSAGPVPGWTIAGTNDFNTDGNPDLLWQNDTTGEIVAWYMGGPDGNVFLGFSSLTTSPLPGWHVAN